MTVTIKLALIVILNNIAKSYPFIPRLHLLSHQNINGFTIHDVISKPVTTFGNFRDVDVQILRDTLNTDRNIGCQRNNDNLSVVDVDVSVFKDKASDNKGVNILSVVCTSDSSVEDGKIIGVLNESIDNILSNKPMFRILICIDRNLASQDVHQTVKNFLLPTIYRLFSTYLIFERQYCGDKYLPSSWANVILELEYAGDIWTKEQKEKMLELLIFSGWDKSKSNGDIDNKSHQSNTCFHVNPEQFIQHLIHFALTNCSDKVKTERFEISNKSTDVMRIISLLSARRIAFDFVNAKPPKTLGKDQHENQGRTISHFSSLLPSKTVDDLTKIMVNIRHKGWLSNNLDSVDELPSLHMNIISGGSPLFENDVDVEENSETNNEFQNLVRQMYFTLKPYLYEEILPKVRNELGFKSLKISDVFVRNYGKDVQTSENRNEDNGNTRFGLSEHYDITASATCVIALDDAASQGTSGLYVIDTNGSAEKSSSHTSLKQFFPLSSGDGVLHTWDVLHGVDIDPSLKRTSLIIWFTEEDDDGSSHLQCFDSPFFDKAIRKFVLALSKENLMTLEYQSPMDNGESDTKPKYYHKDIEKDILDLHLNSASLGNVFALARLGTMLIDQVDGNESMVLTDSQLKDCCTLVANFEWIQNYNESTHWLPLIDLELIINSIGKDDCLIDNNFRRNIAKAVLCEASRRGSAIAQVTLADTLVEDYFALENLSQTLKDDLLNKAAVLFTMASQQGYRPASGSLERLSRLLFSKYLEESNNSDSPSDIESIFLESPVMQIIQTSSPKHFLD